MLKQGATNVVVGNGERGIDPAEQELVARYAAAVAPIASKVVGRLTEKAPTDADDGESAAADLIADSALAATRAPENGGAQVAFVNATGVRIALPAGDILYKDAFAMMPFGNNLVVMTLTGEQLKAALEQQYAIPIKTGRTAPGRARPVGGLHLRRRHVEAGEEAASPTCG